MPGRVSTMRKITVSLPKELVEFADTAAVAMKISRSEVIAEAIAAQREREEARLAAEGYRFYAQEASEFAAASLQAVSEVLGHDGQTG
ncbi:MAG: ribbon-helix-helix domain-containing protein [Anaerolineae bacterium]